MNNHCIRILNYKQIITILLSAICGLAVFGQQKITDPQMLEWNENISVKRISTYSDSANFELSFHNGHANETVLDSLIQEAKQEENQKKLAYLYVQTAIHYNNTIKLEIADSLLVEAASLFAKLKNPFGEMQCYSHLLVLSFNKGDNHQALTYSRKALDLAREYNYKKNIAIIYSNITLMYIKLGDYEKANEYNLLAMRIFQEMGDKLQLARCKLNIGSVYIMLKDNLKALDYITSARDDFYNIDEQTGYSICLTNIGLIYINLKDYRKALPYFFQAVDIDEKNKDNEGISSNYTSIGEVYYHLGNYSRAMEYYTQALQIDKTTGDKSGLAGLYLNISKVYSTLNKPDSAMKYCDMSFQLNRETGELNQKQNILEQKAAIYEDQGNYAKAYSIFQESTQLKDSLFNMDRAAKIAMLEERYTNEKLEKENLALKYTNDIQETKIGNQRNMIRSYLAALFVAIVAMLLIVIQYQKKNSAYKFIVQKNLDLINKDQELKTIKQQMNVLMTSDKSKLLISDDEKERVLSKMEKLLETDKIYTHADLTIDKLAKRLCTNRTYLSQIINEEYHTNYSNFINDYRVKEAMRMLSDPEKKKKFSIEAIAGDSGFNTISNFNMVFKKQTGITPSVFRKIS